MCGTSKTCFNGLDCFSKICFANGNIRTCAAAACDDNTLNGDETCKDAGGPTCYSRCGVDESCVVASDCNSGICNNLRCSAPVTTSMTNNAEEETDSQTLLYSSLMKTANAGGLESLYCNLPLSYQD